MQHSKMKVSLCSAAILITSIDQSLATDFVSKNVNQLESMYVADCKADALPHGFYGAFLQPCEFQFRQLKPESEYHPNPCSDEASILVSKPTPMHWFFNLTEHIKSMDWDDMSSDDLPQVADGLMLWPDQCVGVTPRCYAIDDEAIRDTLHKLFEKTGIPKTATHVQVDCRGDALELSRLVYSFADGFEKSLPTIIFWTVTVCLLSLVATLWCCYGCFRLCSGTTSRKPQYHVVATASPVEANGYSPYQDRVMPETTSVVKKV